jgi:hypothetical protein
VHRCDARRQLPAKARKGRATVSPAVQRLLPFLLDASRSSMIRVYSKTVMRARASCNPWRIAVGFFYYSIGPAWSEMRLGDCWRSESFVHICSVQRTFTIQHGFRPDRWARVRNFRATLSLSWAYATLSLLGLCDSLSLGLMRLSLSWAYAVAVSANRGVYIRNVLRVRALTLGKIDPWFCTPPWRQAAASLIRWPA